MKDNSFPQPIFNIAWNHISPLLTLFIHDSLERIRYRRKIEFPKTLTTENPNLRLLKMDSFPDEEQIDSVTFLTVYPVFLRFLDALLDRKAPRAFKGLCDHFEKISSSEDFQTNFAAYRTFDREIRRDFFHSSSGVIVDINSVEWSSRLLNCKALTMFTTSNSQPSSENSTPFHINKSRDRSAPYSF